MGVVHSEGGGGLAGGSLLMEEGSEEDDLADAGDEDHHRLSDRPPLHPLIQVLGVEATSSLVDPVLLLVVRHQTRRPAQQ